MVFQVRSISGTTKVRENDATPSKLNLSDDLGMDSAGGGRLVLRWDREQVTWFMELELFSSSGKGTFPRDFSYDEGSFKGGVPYTTTWTGFFGRAGVVFRNAFPEPVKGGWIGPMVALEYPRMSLSIKQPLANQASGEQYEQFMPYPVVGIAMSLPLDPSFTMSGRAFAGYMPTMPTAFTEGGRLKMSITTVNFELDLTWRILPWLRLTGGVGYQYWHGTLTSNEDGNDLEFGGPYAQVGLEVRW